MIFPPCTRALFALLALSVFNLSLAQQCAIPGRDGVGNVTTAPNTYFSGATANITAGTTSLTLGAQGAGATTPFAPGDLLLIIQMQDSSGTLEGNFEYARVASVSLGAVTLSAGLTNTYAQSITGTSLQTYQIIRVPQYSSATVGNVDVPPWSLTNAGVGSGGVFVMDVAGTLTINGVINATGKGFRGAFGLVGNGNQAAAVFNTANYTPNLTNISGSLKGEGTNGVPNQVFVGTATPTVYTAGLYAAGTAGQGANGNAGGGGNDGNPASGGNGNNSGGGGGGNAGAGGIGGNSWSFNNAAGGLGGLLQTNSATKLYLGGGGGAGSQNNNNTTNTITAYPPTAPTVPNAASGANPNGATGAVSASGASGGGIVILRASTVAYTSGSIQADGIQAYTSSSSSDAAGGGGAGGSVIVQAASSTGTLPISATGGRGGNSGFYDHGPGGGGGGGFVGTSPGVTVTTVTTGGLNGLDANNGGDNTPSAVGSTPGTGGVASNTLATPPTGAAAPNACNPSLTVTKATSTPTIATAITQATYTITVSNAAGVGAAIGADVVDNALPPGWTFASTSSVTFTPPLSGTAFGGYIEGATAGVPAVAASPGTSANLTVNGAPNTAPVWSNLTIPSGGSVAIQYIVNIPATATVGVYHNPAGVKYLDPTRSTATREVTPFTNNTANLAGAQVGGTTNTTYETGSLATTNIPGTNYNGLVAGAAAEDVTLLADLSVTKTHVGTFSPSGSALAGMYTIVARNNGRGISALSYAINQATPATVAQLTAAPFTVADTLPTGFSLNAAPTITGTDAANWTCTGAAGTSGSFTCTRSVNTGNIAATADMVSISVPVRVNATACPGPVNNTAVISTALIGEGAATANNTVADATALNCNINLTLSKTDGKSTNILGEVNNYVVNLSNAGPASADGAVLSDPATSGLNCGAGGTVLACTPAGGAACPASTTLSALQAGIAIPTLPSGGSVSYALSCTVQ